MSDVENHTDENLAEVLSLARSALDQEFAVTERLDSKARGQITLAGQWFAVAQAVSAIAFSASHSRHWLLVAIGGIALLGGILLACLFFLSASVWRLRREPAVSPRALLDMKQTAYDPESDLQAALIDHYASMLQDRRLTNRARADALSRAEWLWYVTMGIPLLELGFALAARLFV
jgi:hypothetical protein